MRTPVDKTPINSMSKIDGQTTKGAVVEVVWSSGEFCQSSNSIANVNTTNNISKKNFAKEIAIAKAMFGSQIGMFGSRFRRARRLVEHGSNIIVAYRRLGLGSERGFTSRRMFPLVSFEEAADIRRGRDFDIIGGLMDIAAIKVLDKTLEFKREISFVANFELHANEVGDAAGKCFRAASHCKVINLTDHEHTFAFKTANINVALMSGGLELNRFKNGKNVGFPETSRFRVTLKRATDGKDQGPIELNAKTKFIPFGISVVNANKGRLRRRRGVSKGVCCIHAKDEKIFGSGQGDKETEDRMLKTGSISVRVGVNPRCCTRRTITARSSAATAITLDAILPKNAKNDGVISRFGDRGSKHAKGVHAVQLLDFALMP